MTGFAGRGFAVLALAVSFGAALSAAPAHAQSYPTKPVRVVVPFLAGGALDVIARIFSPKLGEVWSRAVVVENKPGAGGNVGAQAVATAEPDGYTLLFAPPGPLSYNGALYPTMGYDPARDFAPITIVVRMPNVLIVGQASPVRTLAELVALGKASPGKLNYGSQGNSSTPHITGALLGVRAGIELVHIPYRGFPPALADLLKGDLSFLFTDAANAVPQLRGGQARALAIASAERWPLLPEVPTLVELGYPGFVSMVWDGLVAPAKTPAPIVAKIHADMARVLADPEVKDRLVQLGLLVVASTPEELARYMTSETTHWREIIQATRVKAD